MSSIKYQGYHVLHIKHSVYVKYEISRVYVVYYILSSVYVKYEISRVYVLHIK